jgi:peptide/nickel transport system ATP-binding protein
VMHNGSLVEEGPVRQILRAPAHDHTQRLLAAVPGMRVGGDGGRS